MTRIVRVPSARRFRRALILTGLMGAALVCAALAPPARAGSPVVVELFTSQGCWSCPPADKVLGKLAARDDIVALSLHVDYWDYLGWRDTFAQKAFTRRQFMYRDSLRERTVYTPQMIVQGIDQATGSNGASVTEAVARARADDAPAKIEIVERDGALKGRISPVNGGGGRAVVFLAKYTRKRVVEIARGENGGKTLTYHNVVDALDALGAWNGDAAEFDLPRPGPGEGIALWTQSGETGPILAAARFEN